MNANAELLNEIQKLRDAISELLSCELGRRACEECTKRLTDAYYTTGPHREQPSNKE